MEKTQIQAGSYGILVEVSSATRADFLCVGSLIFRPDGSAAFAETGIGPVHDCNVAGERYSTNGDFRLTLYLQSHDRQTLTFAYSASTGSVRFCSSAANWAYGERPLVVYPPLLAVLSHLTHRR